MPERPIIAYTDDVRKPKRRIARKADRGVRHSTVTVVQAEIIPLIAVS